MQLRQLPISIAAILSLTAVPVLANGPKAPAPKSGAPTTHGSPKSTTTTTTTHGSQKTTTSSAPKTHGSAPTKTSTTTSTKGNPHKTTTSTTSTTTSGTSSGSTTTTSGGTTTTSSGSTTTSGGSTTTTTPLNPIAQKITSKTQLASKVKTMLPTGMTLDQASLGFKNQGQFIAALHVSQNLGIPFADLKTAMTGIRPLTTTTTSSTKTTSGSTTTGTTTSTTTTGTTTTTSDAPRLSLGQAINKLRPGVDSDAAASTATKQATTDLSGTR